MYETFLSTFLKIYETSLPYKQVTVKPKDVRMSKALNFFLFHVKYLKQKTTESEKIYKDYKNLFNNLIKKAKNNFYIKKLSKCQGNTRRSWQIMKEITGKIKQKNNTYPKALKINKKSLHSVEKITNEFNSFLTNVGPSLAKNIPPVSTSFT